MSGLNDEVGRLHCPENSIQQGRIVTMVSDMEGLNRRIRVPDSAICMRLCHLRVVAACVIFRKGVVK